MTSKVRTLFFCNSCGNEQARWTGKCESCGEWNSLREHTETRKKKSASRQPVDIVKLGDQTNGGAARIKSGIGELDFVLGGGLVPGSVVLIGGEPGIGKSTLLLQMLARLSADGVPALYVSGEESVSQIGMRASRLVEATDRISVASEVQVDVVVEAARQMGAGVLVIDSIQTMVSEANSGAAGGVGQVRECATNLMRFAKTENVVVVLVGHVTKDGSVAGPRALEHMVDTVVYFEGDLHHGHRVLRAVKNRFGSVDEVGVFEMSGTGLRPVENPAAVFLTSGSAATSGTATTAVMEGTRPVYREVQALAARAGYGTAQRVAHGLDHKRMAVLIAVLERRAGVSCSELDVFLSVTAGGRLVDPASDLAVAAALWSSVADRSVPLASLFIGELGLGGEVRPVPSAERRLVEAPRLGFKRAFVPRGVSVEGLDCTEIQHISELSGVFE